MEWIVASLGVARGSILSGGELIELEPCMWRRVDVESSLVLTSNDGKFSDSEDDYLFAGFKVDPSSENVAISASVRALETPEGADQQSGFGIVAIDAIASEEKACRYRNHLLVGCSGRAQETGVRIVGGYTDPAAAATGGRIVDESRILSRGERALLDGQPHMLSLVKNDEGFLAACDGQTIAIAGCDFLMEQDKASVYVGLAAARGVRIEVSGICAKVSPGTMSHAPKGTVAQHSPDYPFPRELLEAEVPRLCDELDGVVYASPHGRASATATRDDPTSIERAIGGAREGARIVLLDGTYTPSGPLIVARGHDGTIDARITLEAEHARKVVIDGSSLEKGTPLFVLDADWWTVKGIVFEKSPLNGIVVCGNMNRIENCVARLCGDTGLTIISRPGASRSEWPQRNMVVDCDSHDNCDRYRCNADGFGAKLRVGSGNVFYRCIAHHNIDDGFDLYTKSTFGPIEPVEIDSCVAYCNGSIETGDKLRTKLGGVGFKLGGENQQVEHEVWNCVAFSNAQIGFGANSNFACGLHFCTETVGDGAGQDQECLHSDLLKLRACEGMLLVDADAAARAEGVSRKPDGSICIPAVLMQRMEKGRRLGASLGMRKRILITVESLAGGGAERTACRIASALSGSHDVFLMFAKKKELKDYDIDSAVTVVDGVAQNPRPLPTIIGSKINSLRYLRRRANLLRDARKRYSIDTTISLLSTPNFLNGLCKGGYRVVCERNDPSQKPATYRRRSIMACKHANYAVFQTQKVKGMYSPQVQGKSCIIPNPVSVSCIAEPSAAKKIVSVGRLNPQKNYGLLIRAFALFHARHREYSLHIYGTGEMRDELERLAVSLGVAGQVIFEGHLDDVHAAICDAQMFVLSSDFEGMSNALIEAMMMGLPCISTACTGSDELITDGVDGLLVPVGDVDELCLAMERLCSDADLRARLAYYARIRAMDFDIDDVIRKWERII